MTKGELVKFLETFDDATEISVVTREMCRNKLTTVRRVVNVHGYTWPFDRLSHEVWLQIEEPLCELKC